MNQTQFRLFILTALATALAIGVSIYYASTLDTSSPPLTDSATGDANSPLPHLILPSTKSFTSDLAGHDPLRVVDSVSYHSPEAELRAKWILRGLVVLGNEVIKVPKKNPDGTDSGETEAKEVEIWAAFFADNPRFYRVGDRLEGTCFIVSDIHFDSEGAYVEVESDRGTRNKLPLKTK